MRAAAAAQLENPMFAIRKRVKLPVVRGLSKGQDLRDWFALGKKASKVLFYCVSLGSLASGSHHGRDCAPQAAACSAATRCELSDELDWLATNLGRCFRAQEVGQSNAFSAQSQRLSQVSSGQPAIWSLGPLATLVAARLAPSKTPISLARLISCLLPRASLPCLFPFGLRFAYSSESASEEPNLRAHSLRGFRSRSSTSLAFN